MDPRVALQETLESLSKLQPGNAALSALKAAIPHLPASNAEAILKILSAEVQRTGTDQATTAPSTAGVVSRKTQRLIDTVLDRSGDEYSRVSAIQKLGERQDPAAVPALIDALKDESEHVREAAAEALLGLKDSIRGGTYRPHVAWRCISTRAAALRAGKEARGAK